MNSKEERYLEQIAKELHQMNRVLERIAQAPIFSKDKDEDLVNYYLDMYKDIPQELHSL